MYNGFLIFFFHLKYMEEPIVCLFVCLEFNAAFNSFGHITAVSAPTHVFLAFPHQYLHNILSKPLTTFSHREEPIVGNS